MKWFPKFGLRSLLCFFACLSVFLAMNSVPWHQRTSLYIDGGDDRGSYNLEVDKYGWPYIYINHFSGEELTPELAIDLDPYNPNGAFASINNKRFRLIDNMAIAFTLSFLLAFTVEFSLRHWKARDLSQTGQRGKAR